MKLTASLVVTIVLACLVDSSFAENPFVTKARTESKTGDHNIQMILELVSENKQKSKNVLQQVVQRIANTSSSRELSFRNGGKKVLRLQSSSSFPHLLPVPEKKDLKNLEGIFSTEVNSEPRKLQEYCEGLCDGGMPPLYPELELIDVDGDGTLETCSEIDELIKLVPTDDYVCLEARFDIQPNCCVPTRPRPDMCEGLCFGGASVINPNLQVFDTNGDGILETCEELDTAIKTFVSEDDYVCQNIRFGIAPYCCEPIAPEDSCGSVCVSGEPPLYPDLVLAIDVTGDNRYDTCEQLDTFAKILPKETNLCQLDRMEAQPYCCSTESRCEGLCPGGEDVINPDTLIYNFWAPEYDDKPNTCSQIDTIIKKFPDFEELCGKNGNIDDDTLSTCCGITNDDGLEDDKTEDDVFLDTCETLCPSGENIKAEFHDKEIFLPDFNTTCGELQSFFPIQMEMRECSLLQTYIGVLECGCSHESSICADNSPLQEKYKSKQINSDPGDTCMDASLIFPSYPEEYQLYLQLIGYVRCGCPTKPPQFEDMCTLCSDGSKIPEEYEDNTYDGEVACWEAAIGIYIIENKDECRFNQVDGYLNCGCPSLPEPVEDPCEICGKKYSVNEDMFVPEFEITCGLAKTYASFIPRDSMDCVEGKIVTYEAGCCSGDARCPDYDYKTFSVYKKDNPIRPCSWINTLSESKAYKICDPSTGQSDALVNCPYTCKGKCTCKDGKWTKFAITAGKLSGQEKNCFWLSRFLKRKRRKVCKRNPEAAKACPNTCEGWCYFK